jgi:hypothetical protein
MISGPYKHIITRISFTYIFLEIVIEDLLEVDVQTHELSQ